MDQPTRRLNAPAAAPKTDDTCPKCSGKMIWVRAIDRGHGNAARNLCLQPLNLPLRLLRKAPETAVAAFMCIVCGYTELYASEPKKMLE